MVALSYPSRQSKNLLRPPKMRRMPHSAIVQGGGILFLRRFEKNE